MKSKSNIIYSILNVNLLDQNMRKTADISHDFSKDPIIYEIYVCRARLNYNPVSNWSHGNSKALYTRNPPTRRHNPTWCRRPTPFIQTGPPTPTRRGVSPGRRVPCVDSFNLAYKNLIPYALCKTCNIIY